MYTYQYDPLNRLTEAQYAVKSGGLWVKDKGANSVHGISYDLNGNIKTLNRQGQIPHTATIDALTYQYQGNQLTRVSDAGDTEGFYDGNKSGDDYDYDAALDTQFTENEREVTLLKGEAMFEVAKDPARPFRVRLGSVIVEANGTRFNVYRREDATTVTVEEGRVSVTTNEDDRTAFDLPAQGLDGVSEQHVAVLVLKAGEEARAFSDGDLVKIEKPDFEKSTAWRERRLVFRSDSLETVAEEFNRYNRRRIDIQVRPKDSRNITGTFDADDPEAFVAFLEKDASLSVIRYEERIVVRPLRTKAAIQ